MTARTPEQWRRSRIRTTHGRHGRMTSRMRAVVADLGPRQGLATRADTARPLVLEVGCGRGEAAIAYALARPEVDIVAVDVHGPGIARLLEDGDGVPNLFVERTDALDLLDHDLGPASLAGLHLFFPDPWPKARHYKRRFVRPDVLDLLADRLRPSAPFLLATDHADYAAWAVEHLDAHPDFERGLTTRPNWRPVTRYERAGLDEGRAITDLAYRRR